MKAETFETFTTFIRRVETRSSLFRGIGESKPLVFACSITDKSRIKAKVRDDLAKICERETPYLVYFFSNQNIPHRRPPRARTRVRRRLRLPPRNP
jgi:hypothetical protein